MGCNGHEFERLHRFDGAGGVRIGNDNINTADIHCPDWIGIAGEDRLDNRRVVARGLPAFRTGPKREAVRADCAFLDVKWEAEPRVVY